MTELCKLEKNGSTSLDLPTERVIDKLVLQQIKKAHEDETAPIVKYPGRYERLFTITCVFKTTADKDTLVSWAKLALTDANFAADYPKLTIGSSTYEVGFHSGPNCTRLAEDSWRVEVEFIECQR